MALGLLSRFKEDYILVEETKNGETRKVPMNNHLSETLKKVIIGNSEGPYLFPKDDGSYYFNYFAKNTAGENT